MTNEELAQALRRDELAISLAVNNYKCTRCPLSGECFTDSFDDPTYRSLP